MRDHLRTRDAIEDDAQLDITVRVVDRAEGSPRRSAELTVADVRGAHLDCTVWERWPGTADWAVDHWYRLRRARGQVWESGPELHVTAATTVQPLGSDIAARLEVETDLFGAYVCAESTPPAAQFGRGG